MTGVKILGQCPGGETMSTEVAVLSKNSIEDVRISLSEFKGRRLVDVRVYVEGNDSSQRVPTKKGVALSVDLVDELIAALEAAREQAKVRGW